MRVCSSLHGCSLLGCLPCMAGCSACRWHPEEEKNIPDFAKQLAEGCDM